MTAADVVIQVEDLSKSYRISHSRTGHDTFREMLGRRLKAVVRPWRRRPDGIPRFSGRTDEEFWALDNVSFEVRRGEVMGVIGRNGAGKSTLLKILSRITEPTRGRATIRGRVASLLEVGTGFHPELTGRENIFLNGAILGMTRAEITARFDEIVDFAEVERFLDTPVKRYSSGMYVRLAFAVAAHLEPEILIIDEVLAVGDVVFQKKCLGKMQTVALTGRTVLFVSHNMQAVASLTDKAVLLEKGRILASGASRAVVDAYLRETSESGLTYRRASGGMAPEITAVQLHPSGPGTVQQHGKPMVLEVQVTTPEGVPNAAISFQILGGNNQPIVHALNLDSEVPMLREPGVYRLTCTFPSVRLYPGHYYINVYFGASEPRREFAAPMNICPFEVAVLDHIREFYWHPNSAVYVEDASWTAIKVA